MALCYENQSEKLPPSLIKIAVMVNEFDCDIVSMTTLVSSWNNLVAERPQYNDKFDDNISGRATIVYVHYYGL